RDVRVRERGAVARLGAQPLEKVLVAGELLAQHLHGDVAAEVAVVGDPDLAHAADGDLAGQVVALAQREPDGGPHPFSTASTTALAIGAATRPPVASEPMEPPCSTTTATATCGSSAGANPVNQACGETSREVWAVPVLPATVTPEICAAVPEPSSTTETIMSRSWEAVDSDTERPMLDGRVSETTSSSASRTVSTENGSISSPPFAIAEVIMAT